MKQTHRFLQGGSAQAYVLGSWNGSTPSLRDSHHNLIPLRSSL